MLNYVVCYSECLIQMIANDLIITYAFKPKNPKLKRWQLVLLMLLMVLPFSTVKFIWNRVDVIRNTAMLMSVVAYVCFTIIFLQGYQWQKLLFIALMAVDSFMGEVITCAILADEINQYAAVQLNYEMPIIVIYLIYEIVFSTILFLLELFIWRRFINKGGYDLKYFLLFSIFPVSQVLTIYTFSREVFEMNTSANKSAVIAIVVGLAADLFLLYMILEQQNKEEIRRKLIETEKAWEVEQNHYYEIEKRREELAGIRHDLNQQFIVITELIHQGKYEKAEEMLITLQEYVAATKEYEYCGDPVVNAVIAENETVCRERGIRFEYDLEIMNVLNLNPVTICSIFSNLLRNAVDAASDDAQGENFVSLKAAVKGDYLHIRVDNSFDGNKKKNQGRPDKRKHYGIEILNQIAGMLNGGMETTIKEQIYSVRMSVENRKENIAEQR